MNPAFSITSIKSIFEAMREEAEDLTDYLNTRDLLDIDVIFQTIAMVIFQHIPNMYDFKTLTF